MKDFEFNHGDQVSDVITGVTGIVVARTDFLTGCNRVSIQPQELNDGKPAEWLHFDEHQVKLKKKEKIKLKAPKKKPGGPRSKSQEAGGK